ncbi:hypothetical protein O0Q50_20180 [Priestia aryabhattai]|uniref:Uncharacterized protein n=1 Tax=Priestia aryabhattai TaxID=412384 RepID=A0AAX6NCH8_PRIAR|nr:hypothetical protein [Priestia aryabhattai]MDU9693497.1 hypothetical protein [Priestia aryabhattai]
MQLRKEVIDQEQAINYFVREKLKKGVKLTDTEVWAKEWMDIYAKNHKKAEKILYKTYHNIPKYVRVWEQRMNLQSTLPMPKKAKKYALEHTFKDKAKELLAKNKCKTKISFEDLNPMDYKMICDWFEKGIEMPEYLKGVMKFKLTFKENLEKLMGKSIQEAMAGAQNVVFFLFFIFFFMTLMLINL